MKKEHIKFVVIGVAVVAVTVLSIRAYKKSKDKKEATAKAAEIAANPLAKYEGKNVYYADANGKYIEGAIYFIKGGKKHLYNDWGIYINKNSDDSIPAVKVDFDKLYAFPDGPMIML
jgi:uncharacterized protein YpmB